MLKFLIGPVLAGAGYAAGSYYGADAEQLVHKSPSDTYDATMTNAPEDGASNQFDWGKGKAYADGMGYSTTQYDPYLIEGNYWMKVPPETTGGGVTITGNHAITSPSQIPAGITDNAGLEPAYRSILTWQPAV